MEIGDKVIFTGTLKGLEPGTVGLISYIGPEWVSIFYPQNFGSRNVYAHSAEIDKLRLV